MKMSDIEKLPMEERRKLMSDLIAQMQREDAEAAQQYADDTAEVCKLFSSRKNIEIPVTVNIIEQPASSQRNDPRVCYEAKRQPSMLAYGFFCIALMYVLGFLASVFVNSVHF